jgi:hypothetical protein
VTRRVPGRIHVRTGIYCRYETDPANPIEWNVST